MIKSIRNVVLLLTMVAVFSPVAVNAQGKKLPAYQTAEEKLLQLQQSKSNIKFSKAGGFVMPSNIRYPGEFEESQAVAISWAEGYTSSGNPTGNVDTTDEWGYISAQLAIHIQEESPVWIRVSKATDTTRVLAYMANMGQPLYNYRFFVDPGEGWWIRDFGPNGVYYGSKDSIAFVDLKYYAGREKDNKFPLFLANQLGYLNFETTTNGEGGNLMSDGFKRVFFSSMMTDQNTNMGIHTPEWTKQQYYDSVTNLFGTPDISDVRTLECDGGTGHIDLYLKMIDEQTIMVAQYPKQMKAQDKQIIEDNYQYLTTLKSVYNRPFRIFRVMHPTGDNGKYNDTTCFKVNNDARSFVNGITVNKMFIYPSYSNSVSGNKTQTDSVTAYFKYIMPGYKIREIDSRSISPYGGEIHCITMQIPAENPVLFWHPSVDGLQPYGTNFHIITKITNHSGIQNAVCKWRKRGAATWNTVTLTDSAGYFIGNIQDNSIAVTDKIEYYLTATTVNGKTAVKPITAPEGYYLIYFQIGVGTEELTINEKDYLFGAYPNPATNQLTIPYYMTNAGNDATIQVYDIHGKLMIDNSYSSQQGINRVTIDISGFDSGIYFYSYRMNNTTISTRKFIIAR